MSIDRANRNIKELIHSLESRNYFYPADLTAVPTVSIISSFFNAHQYFEETYHSISQQTFQNFEWIITDDCSTDLQSIELFKSLNTRHLQIKTVHHSVNRGLAAGRNTAISHALGKYLFFMDLDDLLDPTYLEKCVLFLETNPRFSVVNSYSVGFQNQEYFWSNGFNKAAEFIQQNWVTAMLMYRKEDFDKLGNFDENLRFYEDWERWLRAISSQQKCWTIPEYLHFYRRCDSGLLSTSLQNSNEEQKTAKLIETRYQKYFEKNNICESTPERFSPFEVDLANYKIKVKNTVTSKKNGKNILCIFPWLEVGGADKFNLDLITLLATRNYNITLATTIKSDHPWHHHFYTVTPDIFHLPNFLDESHWLACVRYLIESRQTDIVLISNSYIAYYFLPLLRAELPFVAFIDYTHIYDLGWKGSGYPRVSCQFNQFIDYQIVSSQHLSEFYQDLDARSKDKLKVCYTNVDTDKWVFSPEKRNEIRSSLKITDNQILLLFPARIASQKRPLFLVDIVKQLVSKSLSVAVVILGSGHLLPEMNEKIDRLDLHSFFHILPSVSPEQMLDFYSASDILLLPSEYEGISIAIYEAMSMQLPVVASDVGGQSELLTPETGFLIPKGKGNATEVEEYLKVLVPLINHPELRKRIGSLARQRVSESFSIEKMCNDMENIFDEAIQMCQTRLPVEIDISMAEESLILALEYFHKDRSLANLWNEKCNLEEEKNILSWENHELSWQKDAMETSKFWRMRKLWFKIKQKFESTEIKE
jgi:glycosyltransferase involved in cell wall biosynthesis